VPLEPSDLNDTLTRRRAGCGEERSVESIRCGITLPVELEGKNEGKNPAKRTRKKKRVEQPLF